MPHGVGGIGDGAGCLTEFAKQRITVVQPEPARHVLLILRAQDIGRAPALPERAVVQCIADVEERRAHLVETFARHVGDPRCSHGIKNPRITQAAVGLLEIRFKQVRGVAMPRSTCR